MNVSFRQNDPLNALVIDSETGQPLYEINTSWSFKRPMTTVRRIGDGQSPVVSQIDWSGTLGRYKLQIVDETGAGSWIDVNNFLFRDDMSK